MVDVRQRNSLAFGISKAIAFSVCTVALLSTNFIEAQEFERVQRKGSVDVASTYDLTGLTINESQIHTLLPKDAIPGLTDPKTNSIADSDWLNDDDRVVEIVIADEAMAIPLAILDWHEVVNFELGGRKLAATYCPLCDSAAVFDRAIQLDDGSEMILEFGVSGALYNSNVLLYDKAEKGLWSQLAMEAVSGPRAGTSLSTLPVQLVPFSNFETITSKER